MPLHNEVAVAVAVDVGRARVRVKARAMVRATYSNNAFLRIDKH